MIARRLSVRRLGALAGALLVSTGLTIATGTTAASAAPILRIDPPAESNTKTVSSILDFTTSTFFPPAGNPPAVSSGGEPLDPGEGTQVRLFRSGTNDQIIGNVQEDAEPIVAPTNHLRASFAFGFSASAPPRNPGPYDAYVYIAGQTKEEGDICLACFTVVAAGPPTISSISVPQLPVGSSGPHGFFVSGANYAKDTKVEVLFPASSVVDDNVRLTRADYDGSAVTYSPNQLEQGFNVALEAAPGFRDIRVRNTDGLSTVLSNALRITPVAISAVSPSASGNSGPTRLIFDGRGFYDDPFNPPTVTLAANEVAPITGRLVINSATQVVADFDLFGAAAGKYRVRIANPDGPTSVDSCSPIYTIVDTIGRGGGPATPATAGGRFDCTLKTAPAPEPSESASEEPSASPTECPTDQATESATPTDQPTECASPSESASASTSASASASQSVSASATPTDSRPRARLTLSASRTTIYSGDAISLSGQLVASNGSPLANQTVSVLAKVYPAASATTIARVATDANGTFFVNNLRPPRGADYVAEYDGSDSQNAGATRSNGVHISVKTRIAVASPRSGSTISHTRPIVVTGTTTPNKAGSVIAFQQRIGTSTHRILATGTVRGDGTFAIHRYRDTPLPKGRYTLQVTIGPATGNSASASQEFLVIVN
ncbi:MAG: hypothetical protein ABR520_08645 [Mycobacteriales bacterium]|nr:hypothetical protein [Frankia sp.]